MCYILESSYFKIENLLVEVFVNWILFITNSLDVHADVVQKLLLERGEDVIRLNTDSFSSDRFRLVFNIHQGENSLSFLGKRVNLAEIKSVWYRRPEFLQTNISHSGQNEFAQRELKELLFQLYFNLPNSFWVSDYISLEKSRRKYSQLLTAHSCGFFIPKTCITNDPDEAKRFFAECNENMIYKTLHLPIIQPDKSNEKTLGVPTSLVTNNLINQISLITATGGIFQEYVEKDYEIRVTVIGNQIFSARIDSQNDLSSKVDWRDGVFYGKTDVYAHKLPAEVEQRCFDVTKKMGLNFGALDLIKTPDGEYFFLEINPNGQWLWIEELTGQPLVCTMADLLSKPPSK